METFFFGTILINNRRFLGEWATGEVSSAIWYKNYGREVVGGGGLSCIGCEYWKEPSLGAGYKPKVMIGKRKICGFERIKK